MAKNGVKLHKNRVDFLDPFPSPDYTAWLGSPIFFSSRLSFPQLRSPSQAKLIAV